MRRFIGPLMALSIAGASCKSTTKQSTSEVAGVSGSTISNVERTLRMGESYFRDAQDPRFSEPGKFTEQFASAVEGKNTQQINHALSYPPHVFREDEIENLTKSSIPPDVLQQLMNIFSYDGTSLDDHGIRSTSHLEIIWHAFPIADIESYIKRPEHLETAGLFKETRCKNPGERRFYVSDLGELAFGLTDFREGDEPVYKGPSLSYLAQYPSNFSGADVVDAYKSGMSPEQAHNLFPHEGETTYADPCNEEGIRTKAKPNEIILLFRAQFALSQVLAPHFSFRSANLTDKDVCSAPPEQFQPVLAYRLVRMKYPGFPTKYDARTILSVAKANISAKEATEFEQKMYPEERPSYRNPNAYQEDIPRAIDLWNKCGKPDYKAYSKMLMTRSGCFAPEKTE